MELKNILLKMLIMSYILINLFTVKKYYNFKYAMKLNQLVIEFLI